MKGIKVKVRNMINDNGNSVPNQFIIITDKGVFFQSYSTVIAFEAYTGKIQLDKSSWNASKVTGKYRNIFLNETRKETEVKIASGIYELTDLN